MDVEWETKQRACGCKEKVAVLLDGSGDRNDGALWVMNFLQLSSESNFIALKMLCVL